MGVSDKKIYKLQSVKGASVLQKIKGAALKIMGALHNELNWQTEKKAIQAERHQMQRP